MLPVDPKNYYGMASDRNYGTATYGTLMHTHRFSQDTELVTKVRKGDFNRDQRASTVRIAGAALQPGGILATPLELQQQHRAEPGHPEQDPEHGEPVRPVRPVHQV